MNINGTLINYFFHCKRQCYLAYNRINLEDNSEDVKIGKALHEMKFQNELKFENISIDKITDKYIIEFKKSDSDETAATWQLLFYLKKLKDVGVIRKGKLLFGENKKSLKKSIDIELTPQKEIELLEIYKQINTLLCLPMPPSVPTLSPKCKKCSYFSYCFI